MAKNTIGFLLQGGFNVFTYFLLSWIFHIIFPEYPLITVSIAFLLVSSLSFFMLRRKVFVGDWGFSVYVKYITMLLFMLGLTNLMILATMHVGQSYLVGQSLAVVITTPLSYLSCRYSIFREC